MLPFTVCAYLTAQTHTTRRKLPILIRGHAGIVNIPHVQISIRVNSQPYPSEHTYSFFSEDRLGTSKQCGPS